MKVFTRAQEARRLIEWGRERVGKRGGDAGLWRELSALPPDAHPDAVDGVYESLWPDAPRPCRRTWKHCHECSSYAEIVVELGEEPDDESSTASVCLPCLRKAVAMAEGAK